MVVFMDESKGEISQDNFTTSSSSSEAWDSDEEGGKDIEYQPLPQDPIENGESSDISGSDDEVKSKHTVVLEEHDNSTTASMVQGHVDEVVKAMAGFTLSPSSIPEWAKVVPEDVWKKELLDGLKPKRDCWKNADKSNPSQKSSVKGMQFR